MITTYEDYLKKMRPLQDKIKSLEDEIRKNTAIRNDYRAKLRFIKDESLEVLQSEIENEFSKYLPVKMFRDQKIFLFTENYGIKTVREVVPGNPLWTENFSVIKIHVVYEYNNNYRTTNQFWMFYPGSNLSVEEFVKNLIYELSNIGSQKEENRQKRELKKASKKYNL